MIYTTQRDLSAQCAGFDKMKMQILYKFIADLPFQSTTQREKWKKLTKLVTYKFLGRLRIAYNQKQWSRSSCATLYIIKSCSRYNMPYHATGKPSLVPMTHSLLNQEIIRQRKKWVYGISCVWHKRRRRRRWWLCVLLLLTTITRNFPFHNHEDRLSIRHSDFCRIDFFFFCSEAEVRVGIFHLRSLQSINYSI